MKISAKGANPRKNNRAVEANETGATECQTPMATRDRKTNVTEAFGFVKIRFPKEKNHQETRSMSTDTDMAEEGSAKSVSNGMTENKNVCAARMKNKSEQKTAAYWRAFRI